MKGVINEDMYALGSKRSVIRDLFEFGRKMKEEKGEDKVFDFSLGNPSVPAPEILNRTAVEILQGRDSTSVHGYTSAPGDTAVREAIAKDVNRRFDAGVSASDIYMTCGAAASLRITFGALCCEGDEFAVCAPYFPEYRVFINSAGGVFKTVGYDEKDFQPDMDSMEKVVGPKTKAVLYNSPNNPCGVVYSEDTLKKVCALLTRKSREYGHPIYLISDEPYREIVYAGVQPPYVCNLYDNSIVCYSFSKSLSVPGERIGYILVSPRAEYGRELFNAVAGAGRALGYVCAPSLFQKIITEVVGAEPDIEAYRRNRDLLYGSLSRMGYSCVNPDGAFYLFVKALEEDAGAFSDRAKKLGLLLVPGDSFGAPGYVRIAYCVSYDTISRSLPLFEELYKSYC